MEYEQNGRRLPCPLKWLDSFSMRNFTNASVFDNTLPVGRWSDGDRDPRSCEGIESGDGRLVPEEKLFGEGSVKY